MRILHVTDGYGPRLGGIEVFVEGLARHQSLAGHEVSVLTATPALPDADVDPDTAAGTGAVRGTPSNRAYSASSSSHIVSGQKPASTRARPWAPIRRAS